MTRESPRRHWSGPRRAERSNRPIRERDEIIVDLRAAEEGLLALLPDDAEVLATANLLLDRVSLCSSDLAARSVARISQLRDDALMENTRLRGHWSHAQEPQAALSAAMNRIGDLARAAQGNQVPSEQTWGVALRDLNTVVERMTTSHEGAEQ